MVETPCKGHAGCLTVGESTRCDITGNRPGDVCVRSDEGVAFCAGAAEMLSCRGGKLERVPCRGRGGCELAGDRASCDQSLARVGDPCRSPGGLSCAVDGSSALECAGGAARELFACRGPSACTVKGGKVSCDQTIARLGDACDPRAKGHVACAEDSSALVTCDGARFVASERCGAGTVCTAADGSTACSKR